ncbi:elongation factor 4 [Candidatus Amesbacteria bacterium RIFCSPHIGHO2_02_FULL_48_21]|uniref:Elongation factor 4 n=1 Tax=Candidatus Amesbacteria bacterium GW2011_GWA2_47_11 TaxID=1618357 RepID=A0A0G1TRU5_9BACT|nr:MAG: Elongation factor 4 [Candidatus Amesbacteria bacterium GW2011_GWA2_47_11]OGC96846.1 MAG: elongation factor 4 [Candidatus Amesbacteria bacterium RIFCSPHIGHO2_02_FULL_48_21]
MQNIRNFAIIAHIDHGKSTLADRMLELTGTVSPRQMRAQLLDSNPIERERGITIKLAPVRMEMKYGFENGQFKIYPKDTKILNFEFCTLNLIDTPGHVDFSYEVNRSLAACEGAILLVDATQGVQAQTLAHFHQAQKLGLTIIPIINKIDVATADIEGTKRQIHDILNLDLDSILFISAKTGQGVPELLEAIINRIPPPRTTADGSLTRALVFNSNFDPHLGVIAWIRVVDGQIRTHDKLFLLGTHTETSALEVGFFTPERKPCPTLHAGEVGYVVTTLKDISRLTVGDTITVMNQEPSTINPLPGYQPVKPVVFISLHPTDGSQINLLRDSLARLRLQDSSLTFFPEFSPALGNGFRVGLLGLLHADIVQERLEREFGLNLIAAAPSVSYEIITTNHELSTISKAMDLPDPSQIKTIREPFILLSIYVPEDYLGAVMQLTHSRRGQLQNLEHLARIIHLTYSFPLAELLKDYYDQLKSVSQGFATLDYELSGFYPADLVKLEVLVAGQPVDAMSQIVPRLSAPRVAKALVERLIDLIPRQQFEVAVQAAVGSKILARADVKAFRKDVTAKLYGGDQTRKDKLLKKQKKGKARMKRVGRVDIPQEAFLAILKVS